MLLGRELCQMAQSVYRRDETDGDCRSRSKARFRRNRGHRIRHRYNARAQRSRSKSHHPIANRQTLDIRADTADDTGAFEPEGRAGKTVDQRLFGQEPHRPHDVAEIKARGMDLNFNLAGSDGARGADLPTQSIEPSRMATS